MTGPSATGLKVTVIVQLEFAASVRPQLVEAMAKLPLTLGGKKLALDPPVLESVTTCPLLVVPTVWPAKFKAAGEIESAGPPAVVVVNVPETPPIMRVVVTGELKSTDALCRTHTDWPGEMVPGAAVAEGVQPIEYSPLAIVIAAGAA